MANTTNLNLVKPAGTDKALVSVLNSNSDKIDAWAGTTNQALSNVNTWNNVSVSAIYGTINNIVCKKNSNAVYISIEITGPINAYASFLSGFPAIAGMYYGEMMNSDASKRVRMYIQSDGQWFLRESITEGQTIRTSIMIPLNI